ncbi:hypothetical protein FGG24_gp03 [Mycobacterium phage JC27]|uniref:Uncharacterized protein n=1 Tax=Mycobacterium phage JC27 TaxID=2922210 RepID=G1D352_9CAUD|nr:hypothetical protein FGG24_gp03 [Mycobacterium phage JC27]AEK09202.1 hypothetical protein PBI_JC27_3 [Mycobacterium phage JC27]UVK60553.1 hypothetical protein SEA_PETERSON_2 [Mycobacterium phage Peterson]
MKQCSLPYCDKKFLAKGLCNAHYHQQRRGEELRPIQQFRYRCKFEGCDRPHQAKGYCGRHYQQQLLGRPVTPIGNYRSDEVSYGALHTRIRSSRGSAHEHKCYGCGEAARDWAYMYGDPDEKTSPTGQVYSTDIYRYEPMCRPCHRTFDNAVGRVPA